MRYSRASYWFELANREQANPTASGVSENTESQVRHAVINYLRMMVFEGVSKRF